ncbi:MAG: hypothetical protein V4622_02580 [Bacteroidota bacterium]
MRTIYIILFFGLFSCKKDKVDDIYKTIEPLEYFPAYPGSYWVYSNGDTLKVTDKYEQCIFNSEGYSAVPDYDTLILPKLILNKIYNPNDISAFVNGYSISKQTTSFYKDAAFKGILSLVEGDEFIKSYHDEGHQTIGKTIKTDTTILIGNTIYQDVIVTIEFDKACPSNTNYSAEECADLKEYYSKNIGLIKRESRYNFPTGTAPYITDFELIKCEIKK